MSVFGPVSRSAIGSAVGSVFGAGGFSPRSLFAAGEVGAWYDPSDLTTLFQDDAGTTPVTTAGQRVGRMLDKSGRGNHATQSVLAQRPTYAVEPVTGRRNLLTFTEQFDNAAWSKSNATVTQNAAVAPDGSSTADKLIPDGTLNSHTLGRNTTVWAAGGTAIFSCYLKADSYAFVGVSLYNQTYTGEFRVTLNLTTLTVSTSALGTAPTGLNANIEDVGSGWRRVTATATFASGTGVYAAISVNPTNSNVFGAGSAGNGTDGVLIWGAQLELGSTATAYQRVVTAQDVSEAGVAARPYLFFDGIDDSLATSTITPGADKAPVFAGVRKLSDAAFQSIAELSANIASNNGGFLVGAGASGNTLFGSKGTLYREAAATFASPVSLVVAGLGDISGDSATLRVNGAQSAQITLDQGTGNYLAYPLYLGRRGGASAPFNGHLYGAIVRFSSANLAAAQIAATERWMASKTGVMI